MKPLKKQPNTFKSVEKQPLDLPEHILEKLEIFKRTPIIAQVGGFRPPEGVSSWFGGNFLFPPDTDWYQCNGDPLYPVLQILTEEIGEYAKVFGSAKLVQVFVCQDISKLPFDRAKNGDNWLLLEFDNIDNFSTLPSPEFECPLKPFPVKWKAADEPDLPTWEDSGNYNIGVEIDVDSGYNFIPNHGTKIGGFAEYIQSPAFDNETVEYIFQIASEYKSQFPIGHEGNIYIGKHKKTNQWVLSWDCL